MAVYTPAVRGIVILHTRLHVLELVQNSEHVEEFAQSQQIGLGYKVLPLLSMAQTFDFATETLDGFPLQNKEEGGENKTRVQDPVGQNETVK